MEITKIQHSCKGFTGMEQTKKPQAKQEELSLEEKARRYDLLMQMLGNNPEVCAAKAKIEGNNGLNMACGRIKEANKTREQAEKLLKSDDETLNGEKYNHKNIEDPNHFNYHTKIVSASPYPFEGENSSIYSIAKHYDKDWIIKLEHGDTLLSVRKPTDIDRRGKKDLFIAPEVTWSGLGYYVKGIGYENAKTEEGKTFRRFTADDITLFSKDNKPYAFIKGYSIDSGKKEGSADVIYKMKDGKFEALEKDSEEYTEILTTYCPESATLYNG